ncbi:MAG: hypothetical protein AAFQ94_17370 [Bacteroidota bacterium]
MTRHTFTLTVVLTSMLLFRCSDEAHEKEQIELTQEEVSKLVLEAVAEEQKKQNIVVMQYYNALDESVKEDVTFREYNLSLALKYKKFTERALNNYQNVDNGSDPDSEISKLRESIRRDIDIPEWYWQLREKSNERIKEITHQFF